MFIKQISVFLENKAGTLRELAQLFGKNNIDIRELSIADTQSFGIVRLIVCGDELDNAINILRDAGYMARVNRVICAEVEDKPCGLAKLLEIIEDEQLSIEYMYSCRRTKEGRVLMVLRLSEQERGCDVLREHGVRVYEQTELDAI